MLEPVIIINAPLLPPPVLRESRTVLALIPDNPLRKLLVAPLPTDKAVAWDRGH